MVSPGRGKHSWKLLLLSRQRQRSVSTALNIYFFYFIRNVPDRLILRKSSLHRREVRYSDDSSDGVIWRKDGHGWRWVTLLQLWFKTLKTQTVESLEMWISVIFIWSVGHLGYVVAVFIIDFAHWFTVSLTGRTVVWYIEDHKQHTGYWQVLTAGCQESFSHPYWFLIILSYFG